MSNGPPRGNPEIGGNLRYAQPRAISSPDNDAFDAVATGDLILRDKSGPMIVELINDGRLRAPRESTREILRERLRRAEVLDTGPGWALMRTLGQKPAVKTEPGAKEVVMAGPLGSGAIGLIDIIGFLASGLQTGVLTIAFNDVERAIELHRGDLVWAASNAPAEQIGEFLVRRGKISREQLAVVLRTSPNRIGQACVEQNFLAAHELWAMVQSLHTEIFDQLLAMETGLWTFSRVSEESAQASPVHMPTQHMLMDALRKVDEMRLYRQFIHTPDERIRRIPCHDMAQRLAHVREDHREASTALLGQLTAETTIRELMQRTARSEFDLTATVFHLHKAKLVEVLPAAQRSMGRSPGTPVSKTRSSDVISIYSMAIREMFDELARKKKTDLLLHAARGFLSDQTAGHPPLLYSVRLLTDGSIDQDALLVALQANPVTLQGLCDALDELLFFLLFQATELVGRRRRDDLARRVKMIHGMLSSGEQAGPR